MQINNHSGKETVTGSFLELYLAAGSGVLIDSGLSQDNYTFPPAIDSSVPQLKLLIIASINIILLVCLLSPAQARVLDFQTVLNKAVEHSIDYQIAKIDTNIERHRFVEIRAVLYPGLLLRFGNEYAHIIGNGGIDTVGDVVIANEESSYKHSLIASINYELFNFGADSLVVENADKAIRINELKSDQILLEVQIAAMSDYDEGLRLYKRIKAGTEVLDCRKNIYKYTERLHRSGAVRLDEYNKTAIELAEQSSHLDNLYVALQRVLYRLSDLIGETLIAENTVFADFASIRLSSQDIRVHRLPEILAMDETIEQKKNELSIAGRRMFPRIALSGSYRLFGSDESSFSQSLSNLEGRDAVVTVYMDWPLFSGFRNSAKKKRLREEIEKLKFERARMLNELEHDIDSALKTVQYHSNAIGRYGAQVSNLNQIKNNNFRLANQQLIDQVSFQAEMIVNTQQLLEVELQELDATVAMIKLDLWKRQLR